MPEEDQLVEPVEELGPEARPELVEHAQPHLGLVVLSCHEVEVGVEDGLRPHVGGEDDDRVFEVDRPPLPVGDAPVVEDLIR